MGFFYLLRSEKDIKINKFTDNQNLLFFWFIIFSRLCTTLKLIGLLYLQVRFTPSASCQWGTLFTISGFRNCTLRYLDLLFLRIVYLSSTCCESTSSSQQALQVRYPTTSAEICLYRHWPVSSYTTSLIAEVPSFWLPMDFR